jgi:hypothetical protein
LHPIVVIFSLLLWMRTEKITAIGCNGFVSLCILRERDSSRDSRMHGFCARLNLTFMVLHQAWSTRGNFVEKKNFEIAAGTNVLDISFFSFLFFFFFFFPAVNSTCVHACPAFRYAQFPYVEGFFAHRFAHLVLVILVHLNVDHAGTNVLLSIVLKGNMRISRTPDYRD